MTQRRRSKRSRDRSNTTDEDERYAHWDFVTEFLETRDARSKIACPVRFLRLCNPELHEDLDFISKVATRHGYPFRSLPLGDEEIQDDVRRMFMSDLITRLKMWEEEQEDQRTASKVVGIARYRYQRGVTR